MSHGVINRIGPVATAAIHLRAGLRCTWCGCRTLPGRRHVDHVVPLLKGGPTTPDNLVLACSACNRDRVGRPFMPERAYHYGRTIAQVRAEIRRQTSIPIGRGTELYPRALRRAKEQWPKYFEKQARAQAAYRERVCVRFFEGLAA